MGFKANFRNFVDNHSAFTPPSCALPESYKSHQIRPSSHNRFFQKSAPYTDKFGYLNGQKTVSDGDDQASSFGNKIWGLKVVDCRILFSIKIRDVLFSYVARCLDLFTSQDEETNSVTKDPTVDQSSQRRPSTISLGAKGPKEKATLMDFLAVDEESAQPSPNKRKTRAVNNVGESPLSTPRQRGDSGDMGEVSSVSAHFNVRKTESTDTSLSHGGGLSPGIALSGKGEFNFHEVYPDNDDEVFVDDAAKRTIKSRVYHTGGRGLQRASKTRVSTKKDFNFSISEDDGNNEDDGRRLANVKRLSIETDQLGGIPSNSSSLTNTPYSTTTPKADSGKAAPKPNKKIPINQHFFIVEVIDPQINFLDADKHGSLIIVAGRSSLEGKKLNTAILPPAPTVSSNPVPTDGGESEKAKTTVDPKRRQEIRLKMDGVSAFTIPTLINYDESNEINGDGEEFEDEVFWKQLESTSDARPSYTGTNNGNTFPAITPPAETNGSGHNPGSDMQDSPFLKTAIKDFQIRALYVFWTDVSPAEAKELYVQQSKDALTCTFRLELPELAVDIFSWQFYVILNVVRNVLLVPPPVTSSSRNKGKNGEAEEPESAVVELSRDADLLSRFDIRANIHNMLDLMKQRNCEEVRMLVEEYLSKAIENSAIARFVEIFIGRVYWKLRTNTNNLSSNDSEGSTPSSSSAQKNKKKKSNANPNDQELVEAALTGIYATLNFFEDRRVSSLFEIQRFWAKNLDPGADSAAFVDKTSILVPILEQKDICTRCGVEFTAEENNSTACAFHGDDDGLPGEYKEKIVLDEITGKEQRFKAWTCCGRTHQFAPGCSKGPHNCKEVMISIRAEAHAPIRIENVDVTVIKQLEISIFPCSNYFLRLQITKSLADLLHKYFSIDRVEAYESASAQYNSGNNSETNSDASSNTNTNSQGSNSQKKSKKIIPKVFKLKSKSKKKGGSETSSVDSDNRARAFSTGLAANTAEDNKGQVAHRARRSLTTSSAIDISQRKSTAVKKQEGLYILYLRVGDINVDVSTAGFGFALNLDRFQAVMDKFFCKKQVLDWKRLIWQLEKHLVTSLIKHTASNSITKLFSLGRRQTNLLGNNAFMTNSRVNDSHSQSTTQQGIAALAVTPAAADPELVLNTKKNMLFGATAKSRTSTIAIMPRRPTLYSTPTPASYHPHAEEESGERVKTHRESLTEKAQQVITNAFGSTSSAPSTPSVATSSAPRRASAPSTLATSLFSSPQATAHSGEDIQSDNEPATSSVNTKPLPPSSPSSERPVNPLNNPKKEKAKFLGLF